MSTTNQIGIFQQAVDYLTLLDEIISGRALIIRRVSNRRKAASGDVT